MSIPEAKTDTEFVLVCPQADYPGGERPWWAATEVVVLNVGAAAAAVAMTAEGVATPLSLTLRRAGSLTAIGADLPRHGGQDDVRAVYPRWGDETTITVSTADICGVMPPVAELARLRDAERIRLGLPRVIRNTGQAMACPWPAGAFVQGGDSGVVFSRKTNETYRTAFVEVSTDESGFLRGEGDTVSAAEAAAWAKYQKRTACPGHEYEARGYRNGAGFCRHCNRFESNVFDVKLVGYPCVVCGVGTNYHSKGEDWWCEAHAEQSYEFVCEHGRKHAYAWMAEECDCVPRPPAELDPEALERVMTALARSTKPGMEDGGPLDNEDTPQA